MVSAWVVAILLAFVKGMRNVNTSLCSEVQTSTPVVATGSHVTAWCVISNDCPLAEGQDVHVQWHLGQHLLPSSPATANESGSISRVFISNFTDTRAFLTCCVLVGQSCQKVGGVEIKSGFSPSVPQNLSCVTNLTTPSTLTCSWDPGKNTQLPTQYTLHTEISDLPKSERKKTYEIPLGVHHFTIQRGDFVLFSDMEIFVRAVNALGQATSKHLLLEPVASAKFDPPNIVAIQSEPNSNGCLKFCWSLSDQLLWVPETGLNLEVLLKPADKERWNEKMLPASTSVIPVTPVMHGTPIKVCRLLHGKEYLARLRVRYNQSPWSEWSHSHVGVTQEKAPTGRLNFWTKVSWEQSKKNLTVCLLWKPSNQFRANSKNVSYIVSFLRARGERIQVCSTSASRCTFQLPREIRRVFLSAVNAAGRSIPTEVPVILNRALPAVSDVSVISHGDASLMVEWAKVSPSDITGYVVEWRPLCENDPPPIFFDWNDRNQSSFVISQGIEPYRPYGISVYATYKHEIGISRTIEAYSRQKAPSEAPILRIRKNWHPQIELTWDEVPLSKRNGIIHSYKIFYWKKQGNVNVVNGDLTQRTAVLNEISSTSFLEAFIMVSTYGGSFNGTTVQFVKPETIDALEVVMAVIVVCVGVSLFVICTALICLTKQKRLKTCFWPMIPDPANSSIKMWTTSEEIQDTSPIQELPSVCLSNLSFIDIPNKILEEGGVQFKDDPWLDYGSGNDTSDLGESICGSPLSPGYSGSQQESVIYGTVIFVGPYASQPASTPACQPASQPASQPAAQREAQSPKYLRSESTQPLLYEEEPDSPKPFLDTHIFNHGLPSEEMAFRECQDGAQGQGGVGFLWEDFPLLRALTMNDAENDI
ncbi:granulocyte colony-stimulating factor receptor [Osmerus mordax]|uniref:granulocyte colony-stimulating factor receptor n=1 Tax=Osmerus mordax TaxID=8014 RepID=UPI00350FD5E1